GVGSSLSNGDSATENISATSPGVGSSLFNGHSAKKNISAASPLSSSVPNKSLDGLASLVGKAEEHEQPCFEDENVSLRDPSLPLSKPQLQCDFNLVLEDSMGNDKLFASMEEMESVMETSMAPEEGALLVLDDSEENISQGGHSFEKSMDLERKSRNLSVDMKRSKHKMEGGPEVTDFQNKMDIMNSSQVNGSGEFSIIEESDEEDVLFSTKRKATRRICSESEAESSVFLNDENERVFSPFHSPSVKLVSASTPKSGKSMADKLLLQRSSLGGRRRSIASRRSLVDL
ncbi:hypothetical protein GDO81_023220, partial [Engystomops pustulosus]